MVDNKQRLNMAVTMIEHSHYQSAESLLQSIVPEDLHTRRELVFCLADLYYRTEAYNRSLALMERYLLDARDVNKCQVYWLYALCLYSAGKPKQALNYLLSCQQMVMETAYEREQDRAYDLYNIFRELGHVAFTLSQFEQSRDFYRQCGKYSRTALEQCSYHACLADTYLYSGDREEFESHCLQALDLYFASEQKQELDWLWPWLCSSMARMGNYRLAKDFFVVLKDKGMLAKFPDTGLPALHWQYFLPRLFRTRFGDRIYQALEQSFPGAGRVIFSATLRMFSPWLLGGFLLLALFFSLQ